jgi:hypothetical protein
MARRNQGRRYEPDEWAYFMLESWLEYEKETVSHGEHELDVSYADVEDIDVYDLEWTPELTKAVADYERDVEKAIRAYAKKHPLAEDVDVDDIMQTGAPGDVYLALDGSGAGDINYGEWDRFFVGGVKESDLVAFLKKRLGKYVDDSGAGKIPEEMMQTVYLAFRQKEEEGDRYGGEEYEAKPQEEDYVVEQRGDRWCYLQIATRQGLRCFDSQKKMEQAIVAQMKSENYYPNVWLDYERGDPRDLYEFEHVERNPKRKAKKTRKKAPKRRGKARKKRGSGTKRNPDVSAAKRRAMRG